MPLVTVGVSTYNRKDYLRESLNSVLQQTWQDFEVIVVDDGSTDGTDAMVAEEFPQVRYFAKANGGDASAKNFAAAQAWGEFIVFHDSDDLLFPDSLARLVAPLLEDRNACSYGNYMRINENGRELDTRRKLRTYPSGNILAALLEHIIVSSCGFMMPLASFRKIGGFDVTMKIGHDYKFALEMALDHHFYVLNSPVFKRRRHGANLSCSSYGKVKMLSDMIEKFGVEHQLDPTVLRPRLGRYQATLAREALREKMPRELVKAHLERALKLDFRWKTLLRYIFC